MAGRKPQLLKVSSSVNSFKDTSNLDHFVVDERSSDWAECRIVEKRLEHHPVMLVLREEKGRDTGKSKEIFSMK